MNFDEWFIISFMSSERRLTDLIGTDFPVRVRSLEVPEEEIARKFYYMVAKHVGIAGMATEEPQLENLKEYFFKHPQEIYQKYFLNLNYFPEHLFGDEKDVVFFDLETLFLPKDLEVAPGVNHISKQRLGIAVTIDAE